MINRRGSSWAVLTLAVVCAASACGSGTTSGADGTKKAKEIRTSTAGTYWKVRDSLPTTLDTPAGQGWFLKCTKSSGTEYTVEEYLEPIKDKPTMQQLLAQIESALNPQGWKFTSEGQVPNADKSAATTEKLYGYIARKDGKTVHLTLHEGSGKEPAAGYLNVSSSCEQFGSAQKDLLAKYATGSGGGRDDYRQSTSSPDPVPTGFPTPAL
jgi:hypothetical protein